MKYEADLVKINEDETETVIVELRSDTGEYLARLMSAVANVGVNVNPMTPTPITEYTLFLSKLCDRPTEIIASDNLVWRMTYN